MVTHVRKRRQVLCRLERPQRQAAPQILYLTTRRAPLRSRTKGARPPKNEGVGETVAHILNAAYPDNSVYRRAARYLIAAAGSLPAKRLSAAQAIEADEAIARSGHQHSTKWTESTALRRILRSLWELHGAPKLDEHIRRYPGVRPRNVVARREEVDALLAAAPDGLRLWLLLCSDLAIRSGTAARLNSRDYDPDTAYLRFTTKHHARVSLPVTEEIRALLGQCDLDNPIPFIRQLWQRGRSAQNRPLGPHFDTGGTLRKHFRALCATLGITRHITPHDMRRASAVAMLEYTHDVRDVQALLGHRNLNATLWYLDHDLRPIKRSTLEIIKRPAWREEHTA